MAILYNATFSVISIIPLYHGNHNIHLKEMIMMMKPVFTGPKCLVEFYLVLRVRLRSIAKIILHYRQRNANRLKKKKKKNRWQPSVGTKFWKTMMTITAGQIVKITIIKKKSEYYGR